MDDVQLHLTDSTSDTNESLSFPAGGVYGLDRSHIEQAEDALKLVDRALTKLNLIADEEDAAESRVIRLVLGDDNEPPRAA